MKHHNSEYYRVRKGLTRHGLNNISTLTWNIGKVPMKSNTEPLLHSNLYNYRDEQLHINNSIIFICIFMLNI